MRVMLPWRFIVDRTPPPRYRALLPVVFGAFLTARCGNSPMGPSPPTGRLALTCPAATVAPAITAAAASVTFAEPNVTGGTAPVSVRCMPASGSAFGIGTSQVTCVGTDALQQTSSCEFGVTVVPTRFVAFGDSITEGKLASGIVIANGYPLGLQTLLVNGYATPSIVVVNRGLGGETAVDGLIRLPGVLSGEAPQALLLLEGFNDLSGGNSAAIPSAVDALRRMVRLARNRGLSVFLATLLPERPGGSRAGGLKLIPAANDQIRQIAMSEGATLVDLYQDFGGSPDPDIGDDGLHPTEGGYARIALSFFTIIQTTLRLPPGEPFLP